MAASLSSDSTEASIDGIFQQELELLQEIFIHEIEVKRKNGCPCELVVTLHPATADRADLQYVTLTLVIRIMKEYPDVLPEITIKNPRGLSEEEVANLQKQLQECASARLGEAMLYELIVMAKESLTANNTPSCPCVICCHNFVGTDVFTKTQCYHYFHNNCLARYIRYAQENEEPVVCPVCREPLSEADNQVSDTGRQTEEDASKFVVDPKLRAWQKKMAALKVKQAKRGGIIDVVANSNKYLLDISSTPSTPLLPSSISVNLEEKRETEEKGFQIDQKEGLVPQREDPEKSRNSGEIERNGRQGPDRPPSASRRGQTRDGRKFSAGRGNRIRDEGRRGDGRYGRDQRPHSGKGQYERRNRGSANSFNPQRGRGRNDSNNTTRGDGRDREREPRNNRLGTPGAKHAERGKREIEEEEEEEEEGFNFYGTKEEGVAEKVSDGERSVRREECGITSGHVGDAPPSRLPSSSVAVVRDGHGEIGVKSEEDKTKPVMGVEKNPRGGSKESDGHKRRPANQYSDRNRRTRRTRVTGGQSETQNGKRNESRQSKNSDRTSSLGQREFTVNKMENDDATHKTKKETRGRGQRSDGARQRNDPSMPQKKVEPARVEEVKKCENVLRTVGEVAKEKPSKVSAPPGFNSGTKPRPPPGFEDFR